MATSSILDGNSFTLADAPELSADDRALIERRARVLGSSYRLFYRRPLHLVRGLGSRVYDAEGKEYLDAYNNVASVGHCNPAVVRAVSTQLQRLSTHSRYLQDNVVEYAERILSTVPPALDRVMFTNSGSESNDLALRVARFFTGGEGVVVTAEAYHGTSAACAEVSPAAGVPSGLPGHVIAVQPPDTYRIAPGADVGAAFGERVAQAFDELQRRGHRPAALLLDTILSSDGVFPHPELLTAAFRATHAAGALVIADEVQPGFARVGRRFWGFAGSKELPDLVTTGKPMGNGVPVSAMFARGDVLDPFGASVPYFNTFGGSSVPIAAALAVLDEIEHRELPANAEAVGAFIHAGLAELALDHAAIGDVRSAGLYFGVELVSDRETRAPATGFASDLVNACRDLGLLLSVCGPDSNVLKMRPMLTYDHADATELLEKLDGALSSVADSRAGRS